MRVRWAAVAIAVLGVPLAALFAATQPASSTARCPVTRPNLSTDPNAGFSADAFNYGNAQIRAT